MQANRESEFALELRHVNHHYGSKQILFDMNLQLPPDRIYGLLGRNGAGKTTLINLIMRFYDVCSGAILIDGKNINDFTKKSLRKNVGMVLQNTWIKNGTVRENISIGKEDATLDEIIEVAKLSHAHSFIKRLPQQYDTVINENDGLLSQGQRQLFCVSRMFLTLPPILILDVATSSIDTRTEI